MTVKRNTRRGFTLVELLVVIAIIGILVAPLAPRYSGGAGSGTRIAVSKQFETIVAGVHQSSRYVRLPALGRLGLPMGSGPRSGHRKVAAWQLGLLDLAVPRRNGDFMI